MGSLKLSLLICHALEQTSYDVHLGKTLALYENEILDAKSHNKIRTFEIPDEGYVLMPDKFYLGVTQEYTETHAHVPFLEEGSMKFKNKF